MRDYSKESLSRQEQMEVWRFEGREIEKDYIWFQLVSRLESSLTVSKWLDRSTVEDVPKMAAALLAVFADEGRS